MRPDNNKSFSLCFLGCGHITGAHAKLIKTLDADVTLSFASRSSQKATEYVGKYGGQRSYGSYQEAISSDAEDVIMINTPPDSHFELTRAALEAGKHVIVEKPPFLRSEDFNVVGKLADQKGLQLLVAENYYYKPLRYRLEALLREQVIGEPLFMQINSSKLQASKNDWRDNKSIVGYGALYEGGIHWLSIINNLGFEVERYFGHNPRPSADLERSMQLTARTKEGLVINLLYSWEVDTIFKGLRKSKIYGTKGSITFETNGVFIIVRGRRTKFYGPSISDIQGSKGMFRDFFKSIRTNSEAQYTWQKAQKDLYAIEQTYLSSAR